MPVHFLVVPHGGGVEKTKPPVGHLTHHGQHSGAGWGFCKNEPNAGIVDGSRKPWVKQTRFCKTNPMARGGTAEADIEISSNSDF